jgi:hypothetical protein
LSCSGGTFQDLQFPMKRFSFWASIRTMFFILCLHKSTLLCVLLCYSCGPFQGLKSSLGHLGHSLLFPISGSDQPLLFSLICLLTSTSVHPHTLPT